jgi:hypothetical protein
MGLESTGFNYFVANGVVGTESALAAASATGVTKTEKIGANKIVTLTLTNKVIAVTDTGGAAGGHGSLKLLDLPEGNVLFLNASTNLTVARVSTGIVATAALIGSVGSAAVSTADSTLTTTEANIVPSTSATLTAGAGTLKGETTAIAFVDGTATPAGVFLNFAVPDAGITATDSLTVNGTITVIYNVSGDN